MFDHVAAGEAMLRAAIAAADPAEPVRAALQAAPELTSNREVRVIAIGKAACRMAAAAQLELRDRISAQLVIVPHDLACEHALHAAHPVPDNSSVAAADAVIHAVHATPPDALLLVLLSGGASALVARPLASVDIADYADTVRRLSRGGATISELNAVRKHLDALKGGRLAALAAPRRVLGLILSDVVGDDVAVIASGPLSPDPTTFADAMQVLRRYRLWDSCAESVRMALSPRGGAVPAETPKFARDIAHARTEVVGGNALARHGAAAAARSLGYDVVLPDSPVVGEARVAAVHLARSARHSLRERQAGAAPLCIVTGGETTVTVRGTGRGGRNQELVLATALALEDVPHVTIGSVGTDGIDGDSDAAGAVANGFLLGRARRSGESPEAYLDDNDSDGFFRRNGGHIITGPTGTNVVDVQVLLLHTF